MASVPEKLTASGRLYHPFASGGRSAAPVADGSRLVDLDRHGDGDLDVACPIRRARDDGCRASRPSASSRRSRPLQGRVGAGQPVDGDVVMYQPFVPSVAVITGVITGGAGSPGTVGRPLAPAGASSTVATPTRSSRSSRSVTAARQPDAQPSFWRTERTLRRRRTSGRTPFPRPKVLLVYKRVNVRPAPFS